MTKAFAFLEVDRNMACAACVPSIHRDYVDPVVAVLDVAGHATPLCAYHIQLLVSGLVESLVDATYEVKAEVSGS